MGRSVDVGMMVRCIKMSGKMTSTWPPDPGSDLRDRLFSGVLWWASFINVLVLLVPMVLAVYHHRLELDVMMIILSELTALCEVFFNLIICKFQRRRLQTLLLEVTKYVNDAERGEKIVLQKYVDRYLPFLIVVGISYSLAAVAFSCGPLAMNMTLPAEAWYPFPVESFSTQCSLYVLQVLAILQTGLCITVDFMIGMMLWYAAARVEMLGTKMTSVKNEIQLRRCIDEHQKLISFVRETGYAARFIILKSNVTMAVVVICGVFPLIHNEPFPVVSQFILMVLGGLLRLYVSAWPADDLREMSEEIAFSIYNSHWIDASPQLQKTILLVIHRSQKPLVISVAGIFPALTLKFYSKFVSSTLSYFMTIRAMLGE